MTTINDNHDTSRDQYVSHKLYLEIRAGNRYYNLGYMMYKEIINDPLLANNTNLQNAILNFNIALLFNKNDVDANARKKELCDKYGPNGTLSTGMTTDLMTTWENEAKAIYRNCKC
jgi:hypothetical protein